jgi:hypothetical protein
MSHDRPEVAAGQVIAAASLVTSVRQRRRVVDAVTVIATE